MQQRFDQSIFFLLDGFRPDVLQELVIEQRLPHLRDLFFDGGTYFTGTTVFPSTTGPAYLPYLTGCYPGTCNVPGIRWVDRNLFNGNWKREATRSYVGYESFFFNRDIHPSPRTMFELFPNHLSIHNMVNRGALKNSEPWKIFSSLLIFAAKLSHQWHWVDDFAASLTKKFLRQHHPTFSFVAFLGVDEAAHLSTPFSKKTLAAYERVDACIGKIVKELKQKKIYDRTLIFAASDHGLSTTKKHFELCDFIDQLGFKTFVYPKVFQKNSTAACMVSGNAMAHLYFKKGDSWRDAVDHEYLMEKKVIESLLQFRSIDILLSRTAQGVMVQSDRGMAHIEQSNGKLVYQSLKGDPFGFSNLDPEQDFYDQILDSDYPDAIMQAWQVMQSSRSGDLVVTSRIGHDLRDRFEIPEHFSSHGSLHREHMLIPILCNQEFETSSPKRSINIFPTMLDWMGIRPEGFPIDGKSF